MNTRFRIYTALLSAFAVSLLASCAKEVTDSADTIEKRVLDAHIKVVYKDTISPLPSGVYVITNKKGTGRAVGEKSSVFVKYSTLDLKNNYLSTNHEEIAKNAGGFSHGTYYGATLFELGNLSMIKGLEEAFLTLREGSSVRILVPSWASRFNFKNSDKNQATTIVYDVEVVKVINDYPLYELDTLASFSNRFYAGLDTVSKGYYFKHISEGAGDSVKVGTSIKYNYVGKLLNGFVFDTNIEDTARKYRIYSSSKTYSPVSMEVHEVGKSATSGDKVVDGFAKALLSMKKGGKAVTFFGSEWGYGANSQAFGIRQQLHFYIEVLAD